MPTLRVKDKVVVIEQTELGLKALDSMLQDGWNFKASICTITKNALGAVPIMGIILTKEVQSTDV
jgi:hypothetical protein